MEHWKWIDFDRETNEHIPDQGLITHIYLGSILQGRFLKSSVLFLF